MPSTTDMATPEDDRRHAPGPESMPLWNESLWFPFYDPKHEIGVVLRVGVLANQRRANLFVYIVRKGEIVHSFIDQQLPVPPIEQGRMTIGGLTIEWLEPLRSFRLRYANGPHGFDVTWTACSPTYTYPHPEGVSYDQLTGHIEQGGTARGTITLGGTPVAIDCSAHRDHSWGGERDWSKFNRWTYLSGEFGTDFWFNAVRIDYGPEVDVRLGGLWDGKELLGLEKVEIEVSTADGGTRQNGVAVTITDERSRTHRIVGDAPVVSCVVRYGQTWLKDGITRYRYGERVGWGIHEHGYVELG